MYIPALETDENLRQYMTDSNRARGQRVDSVLPWVLDSGLSRWRL